MRKMETQGSRLQSLEHDINGNGSIGLKEQCKKNRDRLDKLERMLWIMLIIDALFFGEKLVRVFTHI